MNRQMTVLAAGMAALVIATPILAQRGQGRNGGDRPSRQCIQEIMQLCSQNGRPDRSQIRTCLQSKSGELSSECQTELANRMQQRRGQPPQAGQTPYQRTATPDRAVLYGNHQRQQVDIYEPENAVDEQPLILFVHGGGWRMGSHKQVQSKPVHFGENNLYFASTGYRILPDAPVEQQAKDVGLALQALVAQADDIGFDPTKIVLMGHSAGAHLAALVATDPQYAGEEFEAIKGVILLDGAGYDVAKSMAQGQPQARRLYEDAFGLEAERQKSLSPVTHIGGSDAPNWLALYVDTRIPAKMQAELLVNRLTETGSSAKAVAISNTDHGRMNRELGTEAGKAQTEAVDAFLARILR